MKGAFFSHVLEAYDATLRVMDVGAAPSPDNQNIYDPLISLLGTEVIGFEPDAAARAKLDQTGRSYLRILPHFVGRGGAATFHKCQNPLTSSLYKPNASLLSKFQNLPFPLLDTEPVETVALDSIDLPPCHYIKLDVQGAELDVIEGGLSLVDQAIAIHCEVEFVEAYEGQPLFSDIEKVLRDRGFQFLAFHKPLTRQLTPIVINNDPYHSGAQWLWGDAIFLRSYFDIDAWSSADIARAAAIMHGCYGFVDLAGHLLHQIDLREKTAWLPGYLKYANA